MMPVGNSKKKVPDWQNRGPLKDLNDSKLIVYESKWFPWSFRINFIPFRIFRGPLFHKTITGQQLFFCFLQQTDSSNMLTTICADCMLQNICTYKNISHSYRPTFIHLSILTFWNWSPNSIMDSIPFIYYKFSMGREFEI